jgi:putative ABC transport system permease protein
MDVMARTDIRPQELVPAVRKLLATMDPEVVVFNIATLKDLLSARVSEPRFRSLLIGAFGLAALCLAIVGVYGVMAYAVAQRTREMGIRLALGAEGGRIMKEVFVRGLRLTLVGLGLGLAGAWATVTLIEGYMYQVDVHDPMTFALAFVVLAASSMLACLLPARRAARVDPIIALRAE